jgi:hypothetical protein
MAQAMAGPFIGGQQTAEHPEKGGLAAAVGAEKAEDLTPQNAQVNAVHHGAIPKSLGDTLNVDDRF